MVSAEALGSLVDLIYKTALCGQHWPKFLEALKAACVVDPFLVRIDHKNPWTAPMSMPDGLALPGDNACQCDAVLPRVGNGVFEDPPLPHSSEYGEFVADIKEAMPILVPHLQRAMLLRDTLAGLRRENNDLLFSLDSYGVAAVGVDESGHAVWSTQAARTLLAFRDGIAMVDNKLFVSIPTMQTRLGELIHDASRPSLGIAADGEIRLSGSAASKDGGANTPPVPVGGAMLIERRAPKRPLHVIVSPFPLLEDCNPGGSALVFLSDPDTQPESRQELLRALYAMGPVECRVSDLLASGHEVQCIGEILNISVDTVRFHLKSIFRKTGATRQSELVRLVLGLPGNSEVLYRSNADKIPSQRAVPTLPRKSFTAAD